MRLLFVSCGWLVAVVSATAGAARRAIVPTPKVYKHTGRTAELLGPVRLVERATNRR